MNSRLFFAFVSLGLLACAERSITSELEPSGLVGAEDAGIGVDAAVTNEGGPPQVDAGKGAGDAGSDGNVPLAVPQKLRTGVVNATFDENGLLVTLEAKPQVSQLNVVRGPALSGAAVEVLFTQPSDQSRGSLGMRGGVLFGADSGGLVRRQAGPGGTSMSTMLDYDGVQFVIDGTELFYEGDNGALFTMGFDGGGKTRVDIGAPGGKNALAIDATHRYFTGISPARLYRATKPAGAPVELPLTGMPTGMYVRSLGVSSSHVVGLSYRGTGVSCAGWAWTLWSVPKAGGTVTVLASSPGIFGRMWIDGNDVFLGERACEGEGQAARIWRQPADGSAPRTTIVDLGVDGVASTLEVRDGWLYWTDRLGTLSRVPR